MDHTRARVPGRTLWRSGAPRGARAERNVAKAVEAKAMCHGRTLLEDGRTLGPKSPRKGIAGGSPRRGCRRPAGASPAQRAAMAARIEHYGFISNCMGSALVSNRGSVDWLCIPR